MWRKISSLLISLCLVFQQIGFASIATELNLAGHLSKMSGGFVQDRFRPVHIRFFSFDSQNDNIKVMLDKGDIKELKGKQLDAATQELLNYFLVGINLPSDKFWVNLRPDSEDNIIDDYLARTDVGKIMLETDLQLKKDTAQFTSPETPEGREYWNRLYKKAEELYGYQEVTIPTLTRPWIVPNEIIVRQTNDSAYIYKATLKVMLEQDFIKDSATYSFKDSRAKALNEYSSQLIRELIIPKLTQEVNLSKRYASLRQVYYSIILSRWFKSHFTGQEGKYASRIDRKDLTGLTSAAAWSKSTYFNAYKKSFAQGEYNIKETVRTPTGQVIRSYFSGGQILTGLEVDARMQGASINRTGLGDQLIDAVRNILVTPPGMIIPTTHEKTKASMSSPVTGPYDAPFHLATFDDFGKTVNIHNQTVLYSPDINAPVKGGKITEHGRIIATAENLKELLDNGAKVALIFHQGRPGDPAFIEEPFQHAEMLNRLVGGNRVKAVNDLFGQEAIAAIKGLRPGQCVVLKQVRAKDPSTGKTLEENPWFVPTLRPLFNLFVLGGLSGLGGDTNRITGFKGMPTIADRLMVSEIQAARNDRNPLRPRLALLGGSKVQKVDAIISSTADTVLVGGVAAEAALVAAQMEKDKNYTDTELLALARDVLGLSAANALKMADDGKFFARLPQLARAIQENPDKIILPKDMVYMEGEAPNVVSLVNGRIRNGFDYVLSGIGPQTDAFYASIASRTENPFQSADWAGPLIDSRLQVLWRYSTATAHAVAKIKVWSSGGGDIDEFIKGIGLKPPFTSLAGGARQDLLGGKHIPGIDAAIKNSPEALKNKSFVPATDAEAHTLAHATVFRGLAQAMQSAGGKLVARTATFIRGQQVGTIKVSPTPMDTVLKLSLGDLADVYAGLQTLEIDGQNPWIDFSMTTLRTPTNDHRQINVDAVRQVLAADPNVAVILLQGEYSAKKAKFGTPGEVKTQSVEERLNAVLVAAIRAKGINSAAMPKSSRSLPAFVQVTESSIPGQLKMAIFVPTPKSDIYRLMQLAQDSGINLKEMMEQSKDINDPSFVSTLQALKTEPQLPLLGKALPIPPAPQKAVEPDTTEFNQLEGLTFGGAKINVKTQTIISRDSKAGFADIWPILEQVRQTGKLVRILLPEGSIAEQNLKKILSTGLETKIEAMKGLNFSTHSVTRGRDKFTAFIIAPQVPYVIVGYGNEAIKVAPTLEASGFGKPAVAVNSLERIERVIHAFLMGYDVYHADQVQVDKESKKEVLLYNQEPQKLTEFEGKLFKALVDGCIVKARNELLGGLLLSERGDSVKVNKVIAQAKEKGEREASEMFKKQYKGLFSVALNRGEFKVVVDATPEKIGAQNKKLFYEPAAKLYPGMLFIYQGGEEQGVGYSFSNVSTDYNKLLMEKHIRHVSCNTTGLSTEALSIIEYLGVAMAIDNLAIRRVADPGDFKGGVAATQLQFAYHHGPDLIAVTPDNLQKALQIPEQADKGGKLMYYINTDAAQTGGVTLYHHHVLSLVRLDGKPIDINEVKKALAARPDVALVDFPAGIFNGVRVVELSHNLLPQAVREAPDGANHVLVPVVMVRATDDPSEVMLIYAVPQESIVARGQAHIIHAALRMASKDASTEIVDDATGATALVEALETRLAAPVQPEESIIGPSGFAADESTVESSIPAVEKRVVTSSAAKMIANIKPVVASSSLQIRTTLEVPEGQAKNFFTNDYHGYTLSGLLARPIDRIPDGVVNAIQKKLNQDIAEGKLLSAVVKDFAGTDIDIQVTHRYGERNAAVQRLILEAMREGVLKSQQLGLLKKGIDAASMDLRMLGKALRVKYQPHSISERGSEPVVMVKIIGAGIGAANIKLFHEFFVPGATPLQKLGFVPVVDTTKKEKLPVRGFRAIVRRVDDVLKGNFNGDVWEFEKSAAAEITTVAGTKHYSSKDESLELMALASQPNDFVITAVYAVEGSLVSSKEPLVSVVYQPVYGEQGNLRTLNPTFICRSQSGADAVGGVASMFYDVNFVPGGENGEYYVVTKPVTLKEARKAPKEGTANVVVYGWQSRDNGVIPTEKDGIMDHVGINPPALNPERKLADWLAEIMTTHQFDQPYLTPFAAQEQVEPLRKEQNHLFTRAPKEADIDPIMDEVEAKVASGQYLSVTDDKADMGGKFGHNFTPEYMLAIDRATAIEAVENGKLSDGNIIGFVDKMRLKRGTTVSIGDDSHMLMLGDKSRNSAESHQLSFLAFTRGYYGAVVNGEKPYGLAQDYQGKEAKAAKANPIFYSHFTPRFFEIIRQVMPLDYMGMVDKMEEGWKKWQGTHKETTVLTEPFSGNVSQQGIGSARYLVDIAAGERIFGILAGDKMGPAALNRIIREGVYAALNAGQFAKGLVFEIWDAKAFDEHGNISLDKLPVSYADVADAISELKDKSEQDFVKSSYDNGTLKKGLSVSAKEKLAALLKKAGYVPTERIFLDAQKDKEAIYLYLADSDRFNIKQVWSKKTSAWNINNFQANLDRPVLGSSVTKLGILAGGEYIGKDDPVMVGNMNLMKHIFDFLRTNPLIIQGDMNGSHWLGAIPTASKYAVANKESHPILVGQIYTLSEDGKTLAGVEDVFGKKEYASRRNNMFKFNFEFKKAQLGGQFEPYGTNWRTVEASYPLANLLRKLQDPHSPFLVKNKPEAERQTRPIGIVTETSELFRVAANASSAAVQVRRTPFVGGNWKMAVQTPEEAVKLVEDIAAKISNQGGVETVIAPSYVHIPVVSNALRKLVSDDGKLDPGAIKIAAQNMYSEEKGAFTAGISAAQLKQYGVTYVILGHSEVRRNAKQEPTGESNANVNRKIVTALKSGLIPIVCVGESAKEKADGDTQVVVRNQIRESLAGISSEEDAAKIIIAYEPVWAIGTGKTPTPQEAEVMHSYIRDHLYVMFGVDSGAKIRILYGGSVTDENIAGFMAEPDIDGVLVGGASLKADSFSGIVKASASSAVFGSEPSVYGPHPSQAGLRPLYERIAWARNNAPDSFVIKDIYAFVDQKHGMDPKESISFGMVLADDHVITQNAPVMGGISAGSLEPDTHATVKDAIEFFNKNVRQKLIGLNIARPDAITEKIIQIDEELRAQAKDKERPQFSYIGSELSVGISMISTIALAEELRIPTEVVMNYRYNEYAISHGLATEVRPMSIPINFGVVWEGGKHGVAKSLPDLVKEGIIKDDSRFPARFKEAPNDKKNLLAMVPPQELQTMVFAPNWAKARDIGIKLTTAYQKLLNQKYGIKTKYGAESGFTTDQMRDKNGNVITLNLALDILDEAVSTLKPEEAKFVRYALDIAASEMYIPEIDMYYIGPEAAGNKDGLVTNGQFTQYKLALFKKYSRFISCEDWADEGQTEHWNDAKMIMSNMIQMGDDNVVSKADLIRKYKDVMNAHLQKPNQSGEESVSFAAVATSHKLGNVVVWSHRGTRSPQEVYTAQGAIGTGSFAGKWTLLGPGRSALIAAMTQANALYNKGPYGDVVVPYQGALVLDPNGPYKDYGFAKRLRAEIGPLSAEERIDASASSAVGKGGIDFRPNAMLINYQPMGNFANLKLKLPVLSKAELAGFNVDKELSGIERMVDSQMVPSGQRLKELLAACSQKGELDSHREHLMALLVRIGILEETQCCLQEASNEYKEALVLTDSLT